ncbi:thiolase-like protein [Ceratobasidium sp. AG-I]|nr:thiolase-like protein [Ceratobasidium sp. AG-I]
MASDKRKQNRVFIVGAGMTAFIKPRAQRDTSDMGLEAATKALIDAGITYDKVQAAWVGYAYGDSCCGQRALYNLGMSSIPITNVNNNCSTGSTAVFHAATWIRAGLADCTLALGFEQMQAGSLKSNFPDRAPPMVPWSLATFDIEGGRKEDSEERKKGPMAARMFGNGAKEYGEKYGSTREHLAKIASKNHKHASKNPYSQFRTPWTPEQVLASPPVTDYLTKLMCCPTSDGAGCIIVASESFVHEHNLENQAIEIIGQSMHTDPPATFESRSAMEIVGFEMTQRAAVDAFNQAGEGARRDNVGVVELHDCFAANELLMYDALGLCKPGEAHKLVDAGDNTYGGKYVINPSGGLEAKGHPLGATGLGMHFYITTQLRNWAGPMQAPNVTDKLGLVHNVGLGGAVVVSILKRPEFWKDGGEDGRDRLGYNHACEYKPITLKDVDRAKAKEHSKTLLGYSKL